MMAIEQKEFLPHEQEWPPLKYQKNQTGTNLPICQYQTGPEVNETIIFWN